MYLLWQIFIIQSIGALFPKCYYHCGCSSLLNWRYGLDSNIGVLLTSILCLVLRILHLWVFVVTTFAYLIRLHAWVVITLCLMLMLATMMMTNSSSTTKTMFTFDMFLINFSLESHQCVVVVKISRFVWSIYHLKCLYCLKFKCSGKTRELFFVWFDKKPLFLPLVEDEECNSSNIWRPTCYGWTNKRNWVCLLINL